MSQTSSTKVREQPEKRGVLLTLAEFFSKLVRRYLPDPLAIAIILTILSVVLALTVGRSNPLDVISYWGGGFWDLLAFGMQVVLIILTGFLLAKTPVVDKLLTRLARLPKGNLSAIVLIVVLTGIASWLQWGFGLIIGTIIAQKVAANVRTLHYPLAIASAYSGFVVYGMGISATIPLLINTEGHFLQDQMGVVGLDQTVFHPVIILTTVFTLVSMPFVLALMHPKDPKKVILIDPKVLEIKKPANANAGDKSFGQRVNESPVLGIAAGLLGLTYSVIYFVGGGSIDLDSVNFLFLMLAFLLFGRPSSFITAVAEGVKTVGGVIVQYPFYAGIMAILVGSGLVVTFSEMFAAISSPLTLPLFSFLSAGAINLLVPSGGGQFAVQGPVVVEAAHAIDANVAATAMAVSVGDQWTNMLQPFFLLPVLALSKLKLTDVLGYTIMMLFYTGIIFSVSMLVYAWVMP
ncbi:short-chain fatty acid transporter [Agrococcus casei]|uniref:Short chain fatty acids transporter n=1 Tax=Agrococcus casei LMG 22410 TaxID=1255656 RepID=A0A1R4G383_9MICO|nr:TIGR00366 family protein [Agrococcus casei]SJM62555.1 Short chain fatty acids transporter [Agrococcus casei LMG 22410]